MTTQFRDADAAFKDAISEGRLSSNPYSLIYAGYYMYMGTTDGVDQFKHQDTRSYLLAESSGSEPVHRQLTRKPTRQDALPALAHYLRRTYGD